jgi:hypothetical protein
VFNFTSPAVVDFGRAGCSGMSGNIGCEGEIHGSSMQPIIPNTKYFVLGSRNFSQLLRERSPEIRGRINETATSRPQQAHLLAMTDPNRESRARLEEAAYSLIRWREALNRSEEEADHLADFVFR